MDTLSGYFLVGGYRAVITFLMSKLGGGARRQVVKEMVVPGFAHPISLRIPSSDVLTYWQVFKNREYEFRTNRDPGVVVDAGANIGLASIYFAEKFPECRVVAIEPEQANFEMLLRNTQAYKNITAINAALWSEDGEISLVDAGLGSSGFMVSAGGAEAEDSARSVVRGITVRTLIDELGLERIDVLKLDIEGAEKEVLSNSSGWIAAVDALVVELHERMKIGCNSAFQDAASGFSETWVSGENVVAVRANSCLTRQVNIAS